MRTYPYIQSIRYSTVKMLGSLRPLVWVSVIPNLIVGTPTMSMESVSVRTYPFLIHTISIITTINIPILVATYSDHALKTHRLQLVANTTNGTITPKIFSLSNANTPLQLSHLIDNHKTPVA